MDKFEEAWKQNRHVWESTKNLAKAMYIAGEQSQQAKVEELQTHAQEIHKREIKLFEKTLILTHERDELQKRVDAALARANQACISNEMFHKQFDDVIRILRGEQALKGEGQ